MQVVGRRVRILMHESVNGTQLVGQVPLRGLDGREFAREVVLALVESVQFTFDALALSGSGTAEAV